MPLRAEVGPRDLAKDSVFLARRDTGEKNGTLRSELVANIASLLDEIQDGLFDRAKRMREEHTRTITNVDDFREFFTPQNAKDPEIHGGFARCHYVESPEVEAILKELKVTIRCLPLDEDSEPGVCLFSGRPDARLAIFAKAY